MGTQFFRNNQFVNLFRGCMAGLFLLAGCATNVQMTYFDADTEMAILNEQSGLFKDAEDNYVSAVWRARNHLGAREISRSLYNLGRFYRTQGRFQEAITNLSESIDYAEGIEGLDWILLGRRYIEVATAYAGNGEWEKGCTFIRRVEPREDKFTGKEREYARQIIEAYRKHFEENCAKTGVREHFQAAIIAD